MRDTLNSFFLHWSPDKAIWIADHTLSWDARCAGIYVGFGVGILFHLIAGPRANRLPPLPAMLFLASLLGPLFVDVGTVQLGLRSASNDWRLLTGALFGLGASAFLYPAFIECATAIGIHRSAIGSLRGCAALLGVGLAAIFARNVDSTIVFYLLEGLGILGNLALFVIVAVGPFSLLRPRRTGETRTAG